MSWGRVLVCGAALAGVAGVTCGYPVGPAKPLKDLLVEADLVFKGTVTSGAAAGVAEDAFFRKVHGFEVRDTRFRVLAVLHGEWEDPHLVFRHYAEQAEPMGRMYMPQFHTFADRGTYLVFAVKTKEEGVVRQLWASHTGKEDQGVLRCRADMGTRADKVPEAIYQELLAMVTSKDAEEVCYAIGQLDDLSAGEDRFGATADFERAKVLGVVSKLVGHRDREVALKAITVLGSGNPYLSAERTVFWLAAVGRGRIEGISPMDPEMGNPGGAKYWEELVAVADGADDDAVRARAIRALGLVGYPALRPALEGWLADPSAEVHAAAVLLLADFPGPDTRGRLKTLAGSEVGGVRVEVARAAGYLQDSGLAKMLGTLLADPDQNVRKVAAMSLLAFSPDEPVIAEIFEAQLGNREFAPLFVNALAAADAGPHLDALAEAVEKNLEPKNWWGGRVPALVSWELLFKHLQARPREEVQTGNFDRHLDALEQLRIHSSSEPRDLYAFYLQRGMKERAARFREATKKKAHFDLDRYFNMADENPETYQRQ